VSDAELKKAKDYISGTTLLSLETSEARAEYAAHQEVLKHKIELPDDILARIQKVTAQDIQNLAREVFIDTGLNMAIVGKFKDEGVFQSYFSVEK
jgi:predicted Zn-dependent peptidase